MKSLSQYININSLLNRYIPEMLSPELVELFISLDESDYIEYDDIILETKQQKNPKQQVADCLLCISKILEIKALLNTVYKDHDNDDIKKIKDEYNKLISNQYFHKHNDVKYTDYLSIDSNKIIDKDNTKLLVKLANCIGSRTKADALLSAIKKLNKQITEYTEKLGGDNNEEAEENVENAVEYAKDHPEIKKWLNEIKTICDKWKESINELNKSKVSQEYKTILNKLYKKYCLSLWKQSNVETMTTVEFKKNEENFKNTFNVNKNSIANRIEQSNIVQNILSTNNTEETDETNVSDENIDKLKQIETETLKKDLVKKIAQEVSVDIKILGEMFIKYCTTINDDKQQVIKDLANTQNEDAFVGLNIMLLGTLATKGVNNRKLVITNYWGVIQESIEKNSYDNNFDKQTTKGE